MVGEEMMKGTKTRSGKLLKVTMAREPKSCDRCGAAIRKGAEYYRELPGPIRVPRQIHLGSFCAACGATKRVAAA